MAADEEEEEAEQVEQERDHGLGLWPDRSRWINHLPGGRGFGEGQGAAEGGDERPRIRAEWDRGAG